MMDTLTNLSTYYMSLPSDQKNYLASKWSLHRMQPIPFFYMTCSRGRVNLFDAITMILVLQKDRPEKWRDIKGLFACVVDYLNRLRSLGGFTPPELRNFDCGEMGLISFAYKYIEDGMDNPGQPPILSTVTNVLGLDLVTPLQNRICFSFVETVEKVEYYYVVHDLTWFLNEGPLWFLQGHNVSCSNDEDNRWLEVNRDRLREWGKIRDDFAPFVQESKLEHKEEAV